MPFIPDPLKSEKSDPDPNYSGKPDLPHCFQHYTYLGDSPKRLDPIN
jgi:hypothetical protein